MKCCLNHGLPEKCLNEKHETMNVSQLNTTHKFLKMVVSDECLKYKSVMDACKSKCIKTKFEYNISKDGAIKSIPPEPQSQENNRENPRNNSGNRSIFK